MMVTSKAGLIGYYEGSIKSFVAYLEALNKIKPDPHLENVITTMKETLAEGSELWDKVKMH